MSASSVLITLIIEIGNTNLKHSYGFENIQYKDGELGDLLTFWVSSGSQEHTCVKAGPRHTPEAFPEMCGDITVIPDAPNIAYYTSYCYHGYRLLLKDLHSLDLCQ